MTTHDDIMAMEAFMNKSRRGRPRKLSPEQEAALYSRYRQGGITIPKLALEMGVSPKTTWRRLAEAKGRLNEE